MEILSPSNELYGSRWSWDRRLDTIVWYQRREDRLTRSELHQKLMLRQNQTKQVHLPEVYIMPDASKRNVNRWMNAHRIEDVKDDIEKVRPTYHRDLSSRRVHRPYMWP
jgi:hypothetical protein